MNSNNMYNTDELVERILKTHNKSDINHVDTKFINSVKSLFTTSPFHATSISDKIIFIVSNCNFKYWITGQSSGKENKTFLWRSIISRNTMYEIGYKELVKPLKKYESYDMPSYSSSMTPLELYAIKLCAINRYHGIVSHIDDVLYSYIQHHEKINEFEKLLFACLDLSIEKLYTPDQYSKIVFENG